MFDSLRYMRPIILNLALCCGLTAATGVHSTVAAAAATEPSPQQRPIAPDADGVAAQLADFDFYEDALERFDQGDYANAVIQLKNALRRNPKNTSARILLGKAHIELGDGASAEKELRRAHQAGADETLVLVSRGRAYLLQGKFEEILSELRSGARDADFEADILLIRGEAHLARRELTEAERAFAGSSRLSPGSAEPLIGRANVLLARGALDEAGEFADRAVFLAPEEAGAWYARAEISRAARQLNEAVAYYDRAIEFNPDDAAARLGRAASLIDLERYEAALDDVGFVQNRAPGNPQALYFQALILARQNDLTEAQRVLQEAAVSIQSGGAGSFGQNPSVLLLAGVVNYAQGNFAEAAGYLERFVKARPDNLGASKLLAKVLLRRGEPTAAIDLLLPLVNANLDDPEIYSTLGLAYLRNRQHADAIVMFERVLRLRPGNTEVRTRLGLTRLARGQTDAAIRELQAAMSSDLSATEAGIVLGVLHLQHGRFQQALDTAEILIEREPANPFPHNLAGGAQLALGDIAAARASFERALAGDPSYQPAQLNLARLEAQLGNVEQARARYQAMLERDGGDTDAMIELSRLAEAENSLLDATRWLERARLVDPDLVPPQAHLIDLYVQAGDPEAAAFVGHELLERFPSDTRIVAATAGAELAAGEYAEAASLLRTASEGGRASPEDVTQLAVLQLRARDVDGARASLERALQAEPSLVQAHVMMVEVEVRSGRFDDALRRAEQLRTALPSSFIGDMARGDVLMRMRRPADAADAYASALRLGRTSELLVRFYRARRATGNGGAAVPVLEAWLAEHGQDRVVRRVLASAYTDAGRLPTAIALYEQLLREVPDDAVVLNNLASLFQKSGDPRALSHARLAYDLAPEEAATLDTLAWILLQQGDAASALPPAGARGGCGEAFEAALRAFARGGSGSLSHRGRAAATWPHRRGASGARGRAEHCRGL